MSKIEFYLNKFVYFGLYAILLTPLIFWPRSLFGFMTPKFILFQVLVEIVFASWLILKCWKPSFQHFKSDFNNWLAIALASFIAVSFISAIFGVDFSRSFWGIGARMTGIFAELHFFAWFLVLISFFQLKSDFSQSPTSGDLEVGLWMLKPDFNSYLNFSFFVALIVALSAFYENTSWHLVYGSTLFNNPTFAGPYFIFHFFWGLHQALNYKLSLFWVSPEGRQITNYKGWIFSIGAALLAFVIFLGQIRGVILGILVGLFVLSLGTVFTDAVKRRFKILILASFVLIFIGLAGLWFSRESSFVQNTSILKRLTQVSLSQTTVQTRFFAWRAAFQGFKERSLLGIGPENFNYVFNAHYNPALLKYGLGETWFDKPHNAFLEILTETGIIGSSAYVFIWFIIAIYFYKIFKRNQTNTSIIRIMEAKLSVIFLVSAFIAYLSSMFFSFDSFGSWFGLFLFLAFLVSQNNIDVRHRRNIDVGHQYYLFKGMLIIFILICVFILGYLNYSIWQANIADADALRVFSKNMVQGIELFKKSLRYDTPYNAEYQFDLFASVAGAISKNLPLPNLEQNINFVLEESEKAIAVHPNNAAYYTDLVKLYNILAEKGRDPQIINWAETYGKKSLELSPNRQETLYYLARTSLLKGDTKLAVALTKSAVDIEPFVNTSHWYFGLALIANNQKEAGKIEIKKSLELGFKPQSNKEEDFIKNLGL